MTDTTPNGATVKHERHEDLPPPKSEVGVYGWVYHNLLHPWYNAILTAAGGLLAVVAIWALVDYAFLGAIFIGDGPEACTAEDGSINHACWVFIDARFHQFIYGPFYAEASRWRVDFSFLLLALVATPLFLKEEWIQRKIGLVVAAAATILSLVAYGSGPALIIAFMMFAPYGLTYARVGAILPRSDDNAAVGFGIRLAVIVAAAIAGYLLGWAIVGGQEAAALGWIAAFLAFGLITLNRASLKAWIIFLLIFIYPFIAFFLWVGDGFGLEYIETSRWGGLFLTLVVAGTGIAASLPIGILFALGLGRRSEMPAIRAVSIAFIELWRGVPLITVLFMSSVMLPLFLPEGVNFDKLLRALIGVGLFSAAYMAEVVRGGLQAIPKGQYEAAAAMGLGYWQMMRLIILPQALKLVIPGIVNTFIGLFKDTTLVLIIGLFDLLGSVQAATTDPKWVAMYVEGYIFTAAVFWVFCFSMSRYSMHIERKLHTGHKRR
jgi:general L-amino acid transport system permease protein